MSDGSSPDRADETRPWRRSRLVLALGWIAGLGASLVILHALGRGPLATPPLDAPSSVRTWLDERDTLTAAFAVVRLLAIVATWYLIAVTVIGVVARLVRLPRMVRIADLATLTPVRHIIASIAGLGLTASTVSMAAIAPPGVGGHLAAGHRPVAVARARRAPAPHTTVTMERLPTPPPVPGSATMRVIDDSPAAPPPAITPAPMPSSWTVGSGDTFWHVAQATLSAAWGRPPSGHELMPYWLAVIGHNRHNLADPANPDLIFVGQQLDLPPAPPPPAAAAAAH